MSRTRRATTPAESNGQEPGVATTPRRTALLAPGLRVVELGESVATAVCGRFLGRLGASVTRVLVTGEAGTLDFLGPRIGDGADERSAIGEWLRHGKALSEVDVESSDGRAHLDALIADADVVLVAGTTAQWSERGISLAHVRRLAASAVLGHVTPWGDTGPYSHLRSGELVAQAAGGLLNLLGRAEREPVRLGGHPMQSVTGLLALDGVLIGLFRRQSTGEGASFAISELEATAHLEWKIASSHQAGRPRERRGDEGGGPLVAQTKDGHFGLFFTPPNWPAVKELIDDVRLDDERFADTRGRATYQNELARIVNETTRSQSKTDLYHRAQARGIPAGHVATMSDLLESPQYRSRQAFQQIEIDGIGVGSIPDVPWQVLSASSTDEGGVV
jgi:crotonobetainyl-CoA:carnitine CoA-transferase CaiB-like acyl-CoA transferase